MDTINIKKINDYPAITPRLDTIPEFLKELPWAVWTAEPRHGQPGKYNKAPRNPVTGIKIGADKPDLFGAYDEAVTALITGKYSGIGVLIGGGITGVDIDSLRATRQARPEVEEWISKTREAGAYIESSPSGDGLRVFFRGALPAGSRKKSGPLEVYDSARFLTVTGRRLKGAGSGLVEGSELIAEFLAMLGHSEPAASPTSVVDSDPASEHIDGLCARMADKHAALWQGEWERRQTAFGASGYSSHSDADLALCGAIAREAVSMGVAQAALPATVKAVFEKSGLLRDKWSARPDYQSRTIGLAVSGINLPQTTVTPSEGVGDGFASTEPGDIMAGRLFATVKRGKLLYVTQVGRWLSWDGTRWVWCNCGEEMAAAKEIADRALGWAVDLTRQDAEKHKKRLAFALRLQNLPRLEAMIALAKSEAGMSIGAMTELDADPWLLGVRNGAVDLKTGTLLAPNPDMLITRQAAAEFRRGADCPRWLAFLDAVFDGDVETVQFIQRALGYTLTGTTTEEALFICFGYGANGKSVFANIISVILNDYAQAAPPSLLTVRRDGDAGPRNDIARLCGARVTQINELQQGDRLDEQVVKLLGGRELMTARYLYGEFFDFWPTAKPWLRTNHRPIVTGDDDGIWRRLHLIPFRRKFTGEECDPWLEQKLLEERDGILAWMVEGCLDWKRGGLRPSQTVRRESATYRKESDLLGEFLDERTDRRADAREEQQPLYRAWCGWNDLNGTRSGSKASFSRKLSERGHTEARSNGKRFYMGLCLRPAGMG